MPISEDEELTEIGSTCSGFTDISDLEDLDIPEFPRAEGTIDAGMESETDGEKVNVIVFNLPFVI